MHAISRRDALKGVTLGAGATLLNPVLAQIQAHAAGLPTKPLRVVFVVEGNGCNPEQVQPTTIARKKNAQSQNNVEKLDDQKLTDHTLPESLTPLAKFKDKLTVIQGLSGRVCGGGHSNNYGALGVYSGKAGAMDETIDAALAKALPGIFPHVGVGISDRPDDSIIYNISAWAAQKKLPIQCKPDLAYNTFFGSVAKGTGRQAFDAKTNLLDFMADDVKKLEGTLSGDEKAKLQQHLSAYETMGVRQRKLTEVEGRLRPAAPEVTNRFTSKVETDRLDAHTDVVAGALIGGLTNVAVIASGCGDPYFSVRFTGLGINIGKHGIGHGGSEGGRTWADLSTAIRKFHIELVAKLATKLQGVKEGDGTMLDNTLIVYTSDSAESHHSRCHEWPFVILGDAGGRLKLGNRYLCYPKYGAKGHRTIANLYTTLLHAAGTPRDHFGQQDPMLKDLDQKGPLQELV